MNGEEPTVRFRYTTDGLWLKGNTHIHSTASDGGQTFAELAQRYAARGYAFLFRTDHWVASDTGADTESFPLLWIDGIELDGHDRAGSYFHVVGLGAVSNMDRADGFEAALRAARAQGALTVLAHPHWSGNSFDDGVRWEFDGVEIYNHVCRWLNGKSDGLTHWDAALMHRPDTLAFAVDDAHLRPEHPGWDGGWIVVNAARCAPEPILAAIRRGNFYASCGPEFRSLRLDGEDLSATTSPIRFARLVGPGSKGQRIGSFDGPLMTGFRMRVPTDWRYVYAEIEDEFGRRAWTNNLWVDGRPPGVTGLRKDS